MGATAQAFYPLGATEWDGTDPTGGNVRKMGTAAPGRTNHVSNFATGSGERIVDPGNAVNAGVADISIRGFAINYFGVDGMDSVATAKRVIAAGDWNFSGGFASLINTTQTFAFRVRLYRYSANSATRTLIASGTSASAVSGTAPTVWSVSFNPGAITLEAGETLFVSYAVIKNANSLINEDTTFYTGPDEVGTNLNTMTLPAPGIRTLYLRTLTATAIGVAAIQWRIGVIRAAIAVGVASFTRRIVAARTFAATAVGVAGFARAVIAARTFAATAIGVTAISRRVGKPFAAVAVGLTTIRRSVGVVRAAAAVGVVTIRKAITKTPFAAVAVGVAGFARALIAARTFTATAVGAARGRVDMGMDVLSRIGATDWPLNTPTKTIAGVTRDSAGSPVGSKTVKLMRQSDDARVASTTSHVTTGAYSFTRGGDDPNTYYVLAYDPAVQLHGVSDRDLAPA